MKTTISFLHLEHTEALDDRIHEKSHKLEKYLGGNTHIKWNCYIRKKQHYAEAILIGPHFEYKAKGSTDSLYKTIDIVVNKLEKQLVKKKEKLSGKQSRYSPKLVILEPEMAWTDYDEDTYYDLDIDEAA